MTEAQGDRKSLRHYAITGLSIIVMASLASGCREGNEPAVDKTAAAPAEHDVASPPPPIVALAPVGRVELLAAAAAAADEVASGNPLPKANLDLTDRAFELRLPFGCGEGNAADWGQWSLDPKSRVLRISVRPQMWTDDQAIKALAAGAPYDTAEGFWIERPWTRAETCPAPVPTPPAPDQPDAHQPPTVTAEVPPQRTLAIVQLFSPDAPRTLRRGSRPYSYTGKVPEAVEPKGFRLKLMGRIRGFGDGQPVHCVVLDAFRPPTCAVAVEFTKVVLEDADTGEGLAEWTS